MRCSPCSPTNPIRRADTGRLVSPAIPSAAPALRLLAFKPAIDAAVSRVLHSGRLILGAEVEGFEQELARYLGAAHCVGVASGTDALGLALRALRIGTGDEVITVAMTAAATAVAIRSTGATPRFVDIEPETRGMDPRALQAAITQRTAAIVPVHLHGCPAPIEPILAIADRHGLPVVEDCAQACGATVGARKLGSFGKAAALSFYPTKNLGAMGDGGAVVTSDAEVADRLRRFRHYGLDGSGVAAGWGANSRLDEVQAAVLRVLLPQLDAYNEARREIARGYRESLEGLEIGLPFAAAGATYHHYAVTLADRDQVAGRLARMGIGTQRHYSPPLHQHPAFAEAKLHLPETERLAARTLSLPIQPEVVSGRGQEVVEALRACLA